MSDVESWLRSNGDQLLRWHRGTVVIESYYAKQFQAIGGELDDLICHFEDNCEIDGAINDYLECRKSTA